MKRAKAIEERQQRAIEQKSSLLKNAETAESLKIQSLMYHAEVLASFSEVAAVCGGKLLGRSATFEIRRGEQVILEGKNGSGKSSLMELLTEGTAAHTGEIKKGAGLRISCVPQDTSDLAGSLSSFAEKRGLDESLFKAVLRKMDFERRQFEKDMKDFSEGQKKKVLIAASLCEPAHLYVWDEPFNFIDVYSRI